MSKSYKISNSFSNGVKVSVPGEEKANMYAEKLLNNYTARESLAGWGVQAQRYHVYDSKSERNYHIDALSESIDPKFQKVPPRSFLDTLRDRK